jgi:mono/diheme cytochrome c family protein
MSPETNQSISTFPEPAEPRASSAPVPVWMLILLFILLYWGMVYFDQYGGWFSPQVYAPYKSTIELTAFQPPTGGIDLQRGKQVFENVCALCHNNDGNGKPNQGPPLAGSDWVVGPPNRMIRIPLAGLSGAVQVKGETWTLSMPAMGAALPDDDLAAVLSYMRQSWGNKASPITAEQIKAIRAEIGNRQPFSADELQKIQ